jgi:methionine aminotransferase
MAGVMELREKIAAKIAALYQREVSPLHEITITAGATQAIFTAISALIQPGDEVIQLEPAYDCYRPAVELQGGRVRSHELSAPDFRPDWSAIEALISPRTRLIIINTPQNPSGQVFSDADWRQLAAIIRDKNIFVLSDEVYEHLVFDGQQHASVIRYPELYDRSLAVFSFGKTFHNTGWKIGYCVAPPQLTAAFRSVHQFNVFSVQTPAQYALADYLDQADHYRSLPDFYQAKRDFFRAGLAGSRLQPLACAGTYFQAVDYSAVSDLPDTDFCRQLTTETGVAAIPFSVFYGSGRDQRLIRFCFAKKEETLTAALERLCRL